MGESDYKSIIDRMEDINRNLINAVWREGGCAAVEQIERAARTCESCGHESPAIVPECPICGHRDAAGQT